MIFEERDRAYEAKWAHDKEAHFRIMAKRNASLGEWAAETMKLPAGEASRYVQAVIEAGINGKGADPIFAKLRGDFAARKVSCPDSLIHRKMKEAFEHAEGVVLKKD